MKTKNAETEWYAFKMFGGWRVGEFTKAEAKKFFPDLGSYKNVRGPFSSKHEADEVKNAN